jgi:hypothetical protein
MTIRKSGPNVEQSSRVSSQLLMGAACRPKRENLTMENGQSAVQLWRKVAALL